MAVEHALAAAEPRGEGAEAAKHREKVKAIRAALDKHGYTEEGLKRLGIVKPKSREDEKKYVEKVAASVKGPVAVYADLREAFKTVPEMRDAPATEFRGKVADVKVEGDRATGVIHFDDDPTGRGRMPIVFVKVGDEWRVAPELVKKPGK